MSAMLVLAAACSPDSQARDERGTAPGRADDGNLFAFVDVAAAAGVRLVNTSGDPRRWYIPESNGNGAAWFDLEGDGDLDLFVGNGQGLRYEDGGKRLVVERTAHSALYRNDTAPGGELSFADVSQACGGARSEWIQAIASGDVDGDGDTDLYLGNFDPDVLLVNQGGALADGTAAAGLGSALWSSGAAFGDADNDGDLDLYVANYCLFDLEHPPAEGAREVIEGVEVAWGPVGENKQGFNPGAPDVYYVNDGRGHFRDATRSAGFELPQAAASYAVVWSDVDGDGWQDVLVANDLEPSNLFHNSGAGTFAEEGRERGFAVDGQGRATSAMGLMVDDVDGDGAQDVLRSNFDMEPNSLHLNDGSGRFREAGQLLGLAQGTSDRLGWGGGFFDADVDGDLDLFVANGHVYPQASEIGMSGWAMASQLFEAVRDASGGVHYRDASARAGDDLVRLRSARGVALADADDDGDVDLLVVDIGEPARLLVNRTPRRGHWIGVKLTGTASNRDGYGALVRVTAGGRRQVREARATAGLYSSNDPRVHFGLGPVERAELVEVLWPSGRASRLEDPPLDAYLSIVEPEEVVK